MDQDISCYLLSLSPVTRSVKTLILRIIAVAREAFRCRPPGALVTKASFTL